MYNPRLLLRICILVSAVVLLAACGSQAEPTATATATSVPPTATLIPPTDTPIPPTDTPMPNAPPVTPVFMFDSRIYRAIPYLSDRHLDVVLPEEGDGPYPTLLLLHGAGGDNTALYPMAKYFSQHGYAAVLPHWLSGQYPPDRSVFSNAFCALAWLHANAQVFGFDSGRVFIFGHSAGGHVAAVIGTVDDASEFVEGCPHQLPDSDWMKGVATYGGVFGTKDGYLTVEWPDFNRTAFDFHADSVQLTPEEKDELFGTLMDTDVESWRDISGLSAGAEELLHMLAPYWVDGHEYPFLLIHGEDDLMYLVAPDAFAAQLQAAGSEVKVLLVPGADHAAIFYDSKAGFKDTVEAMEAFFAKVLE